MNKKVYIMCPTDVATGGTELLHQLGYKLLKIGIDAHMFYIGTFENSPVANRFSFYNVPYTNNIEDSENNILVVGETLLNKIYKFRKLKIYAWFLSVNNYIGYYNKNTRISRKIKVVLNDISVKLHNKKWEYLVQSEYAREYCLTHFKTKKINFLSDYLNGTFINDVVKTDFNREKILLYNPKKGLEITKKILEFVDDDIKCIPLEKMTPNEIKKLMCKSMIYIDFGNHPGKDRIPREAAICGCVVVVGNKGAAKNNIDVFIHDKYKFNEEEISVKDIACKINEYVAQYFNIIDDFKEYKKRIVNEETVFEKEVLNIFGR